MSDTQASSRSERPGSWARLRHRLLPAIGVALLATSLAPYAGPALVVDGYPEEPDALVALASHEWERLPALAALAARFRDAEVLLTVPPEPTQFNCFDCAERVDWLSVLGVPPSRVTEVDIRSRGTWGEAEVLLDYSRRHDIRSLVVVTSPYHTRRSLLTFRHAFRHTDIDIGSHAAVGTSEARPAVWWFQAYDRDYVVYEWTALAYYSTRIVADVVTEWLQGDGDRG